jgi:acetyl-CoA carboxylase biotin carboxyl carrier protein
VTLDELESLVIRLSAAGITECEYRSGDLQSRLTSGDGSIEGVLMPANVQSAAAVQNSPGERRSEAPRVIRASASGFFFSAHPFETDACARPGQDVKDGQTLGYLRVGDVLYPVIAPQACQLTEQIALEGGLVVYGDALFAFEAAPDASP